MGLKMFSDESKKLSPRKFSSDNNYMLGEPIPRNFRLLKAKVIGNAIVVKMRYPDAKTYDGNKIMVYEYSKNFYQAVKNNLVDPHFLENKYSPIARFEPTEKGWALAIKLAKEL